MGLLLFLKGAPLWANPTGGVVAAGSASISSAGSTTTINQSTGSAIINWQQFSIASDEATKFFVPTASSVTLNRVLGGNPSAIYGSLSSNGQLILVNPNGIVVGPGGRIDTAGFIGSTLAISDSEFLAGGNLHFTGTDAGAIDNEGTIHASTGDVYLIASQVTNGGSIAAPQGNVGLAAGTDILFQQAGDQHLYVQANPLATTRATGVTNTGTIRAATAELKAAGGNAYALAINNTGAIAATGYKKVNGQVYLTSDGGDISNSGTIAARDPNGNGGTIMLDGHGTTSKGTVLNSGKLIASGRKKSATGGTVDMLGNQVGVTGFGLVDVSGDAGGGTALIGGDEHGANPAIPDADKTYLGPNATIKADALTLGNGGKVVLWGNATTQAYGAISVRGGAQGGNGGFVETSAHTLDVQTAPDLSAPNGTGGTWLLDPSDIFISDTTTTTPGFAAPFDITSGNTYDLAQSDLLTALQGGSITLDASTGTGTGGGTINWTSSTPFDISLSAARTLKLNAPTSVTLQGVTINASGALLNLTLNNNISGAGSVNINSSSIALNGGTFTANGNGYTSSLHASGNSDGILISNTTINAQGGGIDLTGNAGYTFDSTNGLQAGNGVYIGGGSGFTDLIETSGTGNITVMATFDQSITVTEGIDAFNLYGGAGSSGTATLSVASGTLSITGNVQAGTASGLAHGDAGVTGVDMVNGAVVEATAAGGSVTISGNDTRSDSVFYTSVNGSQGQTAVYIGGNTGTTTVSVVGANSGSGGVLTIDGTGGQLDTSNSTTSGGNNPFANGVVIEQGSEISLGNNATFNSTGRGGSVITTGAYTGSSTGISFGNGAQLVAGTGLTLGFTGYGGAVNGGDGSNAADVDSTGVNIEGGSSPATISIPTGGSISLTGTGGAVDISHTTTVAGKDNPNTEGVSIGTGISLEAAGTTTITLMGTGNTVTAGSNTNGNAVGVNIGSGEGTGNANVLISTGSGAIQITGFGGSSPSLGNGVEIHGFKGKLATIETTGGNITITGTGGPNYAGTGTIATNSVPNYGVALYDNVLLQTGGSGTISLTGTGSLYSYGVAVQELSDATLDPNPVLPRITSGGALTIDALSGTGILLDGTFNAASATLGAESTPGDATTISSGNLLISGATVTLTGGNFTAYGTGYVSASNSNDDSNGIDVSTSTINAGGGSINLTGNAGYHNFQSQGLELASGVSINGNSTVETTGTGNITINAIADQSITTPFGITAFDLYGTGNNVTLVDGTLSITGNILAGTSDGTATNAASLTGVEVGGGATVTATGTGSVSLTGDVSGANSVVSGSNSSFVAGIEIGGAASGTTVSVTSGTITMTGTGATVNASSYTGINRIFTTGVQIDTAAMVTGTANSHVIIEGDQNSGTTGNGADVLGLNIDLGAQVSAGNSGTLSLTGDNTGTAVTSSASGNNNVGLEIDGSGNATSIQIGTNGTLTLTGTSGSVDASADVNSLNNQAGTVGINIDSGATVTVGAGTSVTMVGIGGSALTSTADVGETAGVYFQQGTLTFDGNNTVQITGTGGSANDGTNFATNSTNPANTVGVAFDSNSLVTVDTGGALTVTGHGGALSTVSGTASSVGSTFPGDSGIEAHGSIEAMGNATITLDGFGGNVTSGTSHIGTSFGVSVGEDHAASLISTQAGDLLITGVAGTSPNLGVGVVLHGFNNNASTVESTSGTINITGTGGSGNSGPGSFAGFFEPNYGVALVDDSVVKTTSGGNILITGTDGSGDVNGAGVATIELNNATVDPSPVMPQINAGSATLNVDALSNTAIQLNTVSVTAQTAVVGVRTTTGNVTVGALNVPTLTLQGSGNITQTGALTTTRLAVSSGGSVTLNNTGNNISTLGPVSAAGSMSIYTDPGLTLTSSVTDSAPILIESIGGNLTLGSASSITDSGSGNNVTLVTNGNFINNSTSGANAISDSGGNYYIYSTNPNSTTLGGIPVDFTQFSTTYPAGSVPSGNGVFYSVASSGNPGGSNPPSNTGGPDQSGGNQLPPALTPPTTTVAPTTTTTGNQGTQDAGGTQPPPFEFTGTGGFSQTDSQSGGLAFATGSGGQIGSGDAAQMNNGEVNNVSNPAAAGALDSALSLTVHTNLEDALKTLGDFADANFDSGGDGADTGGGDEEMMGSGDVVEIGDGSVKKIPLKSAPKPLQDALGNGVLQGLQPGAGH